MSAKQIGALIAIIACAVGAVGLLLGLDRSIGVGIAVIGIVIGAGVARGNFSSSSHPPAAKRH